MKLGVSYFGNRWLDHAAKDLDGIKASGCDWVLHTFDETDLKFNRGNLGSLTRLSHARGLKVWYSPWGLGGVFGGEAVSGFVGRHPEAAQVLNTGERTPHACPAHPRFRAFMREWLEAVAEAGGDAVLWDEPHLWTASWEGRKERRHVYSVGSPYAQSLWRRRSGRPLPARRGPEIEAFREWLVLDFLRWATRLAKRLKPGLRNAVCMPAERGPWPRPLWERLAALESVDIFSTDPYWKAAPTPNPSKTPLEGFVDDHARGLTDLCRRHGKESLLWIQLFALRRRDHADVDRALRLVEPFRPDHLAAWGYKGTGAYSSIACEGGEALWRRLVRGGARLRKATQGARKGGFFPG